MRILAMTYTLEMSERSILKGWYISDGYDVLEDVEVEEEGR